MLPKLIWYSVVLSSCFIECKRDYPSILSYESKVVTIALPKTETTISINMEPGVSVRALLADYCSTVESYVCEYFVDMFNAAYFGQYIAPYTDADPFYDLFTLRSDVVEYLHETFHYRSYLEIGCHINATFGIVKDMFQQSIGVDPKQGGTHRMTSDEFFATNHHLTFDIIFIDGLHHSDQVAKDIDNALRSLNPGGTIVMHDCNPTTKTSQLRMDVNQQIIEDWWRQGTSHWNGDTWRATLPLRLRDDLEIVIGDFDSGVGVIRNRRNTHRLTKEYEEVLLNSSDPLQAFTYEQFDKKRLELHRLLSFKALQHWLLLDYPQVMRKQRNIPHMNYFLNAAMTRYNSDGGDVGGGISISGSGGDVDAFRLVIINNDDRIQLRIVNGATGHRYNSHDIVLAVLGDQLVSHRDAITQAFESCGLLVMPDDVCEEIVKISLLKLSELRSIYYSNGLDMQQHQQPQQQQQLARYSFCSFIANPSDVVRAAAVGGSPYAEGDWSLTLGPPLNRIFVSDVFDISLLTIEDTVVSHILNSTSAAAITWNSRVCFIHNSNPATSSSGDYYHALLKETLVNLEESGLMVEVSLMVILNYGVLIEESLKASFDHLPQLQWVQVYANDSYFEVPTMRILHKLVRHWEHDRLLEDVQILYLNTAKMNGAYDSGNISIVNDLLHNQVKMKGAASGNISMVNDPLHHLVHRHKTSCHLLRSGEFDCVGLRYNNTVLYPPHHHFDVSHHWWCLSSYIAQLPLLAYEGSAELEPIYWLLNGLASPSSEDDHSAARVYSLLKRRDSATDAVHGDHSEAFDHCLQILE